MSGSTATGTHVRIFKHVMSREHENDGYASLVCMGAKLGHFMVIIIIIIIITAIGLKLGDSITIHIYTQTVQ
jgi:hypothetical protein